MRTISASKSLVEVNQSRKLSGLLISIMEMEQIVVNLPQEIKAVLK